MQVPIIDLALDDESLVPLLHSACKDLGFFYLVNHGIEGTKLQQVLKGCEELFKLPLEEKEKIKAKDSPYFRGYTPFNEERVDPKNQKKGDTKEGFYIGAEPKEGEEPGYFYGPNQWPNPELLPNWKELMQEYFTLCTNLGLRLLSLLGKSVALCADDKEKQIPFDFEQYFNNPNRVIRLLHYNNDRSEIDEGIFGCGAHTDYGVLTFLLTDDVEALQIYPKAGSNNNIDVNDNNWIFVPPLKDAFIVNLGDMLERWTNDYYKSTLHRVINLSGRERYSIPFFFEPDFDTLVEAIPCCTSEKNPPKYEPITSGKYLINKYNDTHGDYIDLITNS